MTNEQVTRTFNAYDSSAPQPPYYLAHPLLFPNLTVFEQLFEQWSFDQDAKPEPYSYAVQPVTYTDRERGPMKIGPYLTAEMGKAGTGRVGHESLWVRAHQVVADVIHGYTVHLNGDTLSFHVIAWNADQALVIAQHSLILGDIWLAVIHPSTVPQRPRVETPEDVVCPRCGENLLDSEGMCPFCQPVSPEAT